MRKLIATILSCFILAQSFGQVPKKISTYILAQYNKTIADRTSGNNPWGMGLGLEAFYNNKTKFKPSIELTGDLYLEDDKVLRLNSDGTIVNDVRGMVNFFVGTSFTPTRSFYLSFSGGPSFIGGETFFGIKPALGFCFSKSQKWTGKISYINIFNRDQKTKEDFSSLSLTLGLRIF